MIKSMYAVCLLVQNFDVSLKFYRDTLGLVLNSQDDKYADFKLGDTLLAIFQKDQAESMFPASHMNSGGGAVYAYQVADVTKGCEELKGKGIEIFSGPSTMPWGQTVAYFKDPDNHIWEITS
jgi:catechol 2,3-dioxygenase-like lactoylglutathione lyase family enzyme